MTERLSESALAGHLTGPWGRVARFAASVTSTNDEALDWAAAGAPEGALVVAEHQSAGRGRRGRTWLAEPSTALLFSLVVRSDDARERGLLTTAAGVACVEMLEGLTGAGVRLRWPNDVVVGGRKLGGILAESRSTGGEPGPVVIGIGINVTWPDGRVPEGIADIAVALGDLLPGPPDRAAVLAALVDAVAATVLALRSPGGPEALIAAATAASEVLGSPVKVSFPDGTHLEGTATRLHDDGALEVTSNGPTVVVRAGDVRRLEPG